jgi:prepilin-type N-terminal cleavage/methylation domain-containing protein
MRSSSSGVTLIELVVVLALLGAALAAIGGMIRSAYRGMSLAERHLEVQQNVRVAVDKVTEELRWGEAVLADPQCGGLCAERITVRISPHNPRSPGQAYVVSFRRDKVQRELERKRGKGVNNLAGSIESLTFRYFDAAGAPAGSPQDVVRVEVTVVASSGSLTPPAARTVVTDVFLRNRPPIPPPP